MAMALRASSSILPMVSRIDPSLLSASLFSSLLASAARSVASLCPLPFSCSRIDWRSDPIQALHIAQWWRPADRHGCCRCRWADITAVGGRYLIWGDVEYDNIMLLLFVSVVTGLISYYAYHETPCVL